MAYIGAKSLANERAVHHSEAAPLAARFFSLAMSLALRLGEIPCFLVPSMLYEDMEEPAQTEGLSVGQEKQYDASDPSSGTWGLTGQGLGSTAGLSILDSSKADHSGSSKCEGSTAGSGSLIRLSLHDDLLACDLLAGYLQLS